MQLPDTTGLAATAYDTLQAPASSAFETAMLAQDKLYVVLAVVLLIWFGILTFLFVTDRKIARLEEEVEAHVSDDELV